MKTLPVSSLLPVTHFWRPGMLLDRGTAKQLAELVSALQSIPKDPETALATKPECLVIKLVWPNAQLSCRWQYPLTIKTNMAFGGPYKGWWLQLCWNRLWAFSTSLSTQIDGNLFMIWEQSMLLWKQKSRMSHIQIRGSEHLVLCYSARYQMLHRHSSLQPLHDCDSIRT